MVLIVWCDALLSYFTVSLWYYYSNIKSGRILIVSDGVVANGSRTYIYISHMHIYIYYVNNDQTRSRMACPIGFYR